MFFGSPEHLTFLRYKVLSPQLRYVVSVKWMEIDTLDIVYVYNVGVYKPGLHTNFFSWWPDRATKIINYQFLVARARNLVARKKSLKWMAATFGSVWH